MITDHYYDKDGEYIYAEDQTWDEETIEELKDSNVYYNHGVHPIKIVPRGLQNPLIVIGWEDDGQIGFEKEYESYKDGFDSFWIDSLIENLQAVKKIIENKEYKEDPYNGEDETSIYEEASWISERGFENPALYRLECAFREDEIEAEIMGYQDDDKELIRVRCRPDTRVMEPTASTIKECGFGIVNEGFLNKDAGDGLYYFVIEETK